MLARLGIDKTKSWADRVEEEDELGSEGGGEGGGEGEDRKTESVICTVSACGADCEPCLQLGLRLRGGGPDPAAAKTAALVEEEEEAAELTKTLEAATAEQFKPRLLLSVRLRGGAVESESGHESGEESGGEGEKGGGEGGGEDGGEGGGEGGGGEGGSEGSGEAADFDAAAKAAALPTAVSALAAIPSTKSILIFDQVRGRRHAIRARVRFGVPRGTPNPPLVPSILPRPSTSRHAIRARVRFGVP